MLHSVTDPETAERFLRLVQRRVISDLTSSFIENNIEWSTYVLAAQAVRSSIAALTNEIADQTYKRGSYTYRDGD